MTTPTETPRPFDVEEAQELLADLRAEMNACEQDMALARAHSPALAPCAPCDTCQRYTRAVDLLDAACQQTAQITALQAEIARLLEYVRHHSDCEKARGTYTTDKKLLGFHGGDFVLLGTERCTCGLDSTLAAERRIAAEE